MAIETGIHELRKLNDQGHISLVQPSDLIDVNEYVISSGSSPVPNLRAVEPVDTLWQAIHLDKSGNQPTLNIQVGEGGSIKAALQPEIYSATSLEIDIKEFQKAIAGQVKEKDLDKAVQKYRISPEKVEDILLLPANSFYTPTPDFSRFIGDINARKLFEEAALELETEASFVQFSLKLREKVINHLLTQSGLSSFQINVEAFGNTLPIELSYEELKTEINKFGSRKAILSFHCIDCEHMEKAGTTKHFTTGEGVVIKDRGRVVKCRQSTQFTYNQTTESVRQLLSQGFFPSGLTSYVLILKSLAPNGALQLRDYSEGRGTYQKVFSEFKPQSPIIATKRIYLGKPGEEKSGYMSALELPKLFRDSDVLNLLETQSPFIVPESDNQPEEVIITHE